MNKSRKIVVVCLTIFAMLTGSLVFFRTDLSADTITNENATVTATFVNEKGQEITSDTIIGRNEKIHSEFLINYDKTDKPTIDNKTWTYEFPSGITYKTSDSDTPFYDGEILMGTYRFTTDGIVLTYNEDYLRNPHNSNITTNIEFDFNVDKDYVSNKTEESIQFPGVSSSLDFKLEDIKANGYKNGTAGDDGKVNFSITISPDADIKNLKVQDILGDNLTFDADSFKFDGNAISNENIIITNKTTHQEATISLGDVEYSSTGWGDKEHTLTYTATIKDKKDFTYTNDTHASATVDGTNNTAKWSYEFNNIPHESENKTTKPSVKINWVSKSNKENKDDNTIDYTIKINDGNIKTDLTGYKLTDTISENQSYVGLITIKNITTGKTETVNPTELNNYVLTGSDQYEITYQTTIDLGDAAIGEGVAYSNDVDVSKNTDKHTANVTGNWVRDYLNPLDKTITKVPNNVDGEAEWKVVIDPTSAGYQYLNNLVYADHLINPTSGNSLQDYEHDSIVVKYDGAIIEDYSVVWDNEWYKPNFVITFPSNTKYSKPIEITYKSHLTEGADGNYKDGQYKNNASITFNDGTTVYDEESFNISNETSVTKKASTPVWNEEKQAYEITWEIAGNCVYSWDANGIKDYGDSSMDFVDTMPEGLNYLEGSAQLKYTPYTSDNPYSDWTNVTPTINGNKLSYTADNIHQYVVHLKYTTLVDNDYLNSVDKDEDGIKDSTVKFSNIVQANVGDENLGSTKANVEINNKILDKTSSISGGHIINYKIEVNAHEQQLSNENTVLLEDVIDPHTTFVLGTLDVKDSLGNSILDDCKVAINETTKDGMPTQMLAITVPDKKALTITYETSLEGNINDTYTVNNNVNIFGINAYQSIDSHNYQITHTAVSGSGIADSIEIHKVDQYNITKNLSGAEFELYRIDLNSANPLPGEKVATGTTDSSGKLKFKSNTHGESLELNILYYFVETKVPSSSDASKKYILDSTPHYFMLKGTTGFDAALQNAKNKLPDIEISNSTFFNITNASTPSPTKISIKAKKQLKDQLDAITVPTNQTFKFALKSIVTPANVDVIQLDTTNDKGTISFDDIPLTKEGNYTFEISEVNGLSNSSGYALDTTKYQVSFKVIKEPTNNALLVDQSSIKYSKDGTEIDKNDVTFTNNATDVGSIKINKKVIDSNNAAFNITDDFYFGVFKENTLIGEIHKVSLSNQNESSVVANNIPVGSYTVYETDKDGNKLNTTFENFTISNNGTTVTVAKDNEQEVTITNKQTASGKYKFSASKEMNGRDYKTGDSYTFTITSNHNDFADTKTITPTSGTEKSFDFAEDQFSEKDINKTYTYTISETVGSIADITYDSTVYTIKLKVTDSDKDGVLEFEATQNGQTLGDITFTNIYKSLNGSAVFGGTKVIENRDFKENEKNTFVLSVDKGDGQGYQVVQTKVFTMDEDSDTTNFKFDPINLSSSEVGQTYTYKIVETAGDDTHITYDNKVYTGKYLIKENNDHIELELKSGTDILYNEASGLTQFIDFLIGKSTNQNALFTNVYTPSKTEANLAITKKIEGTEALSITACNNFFTFELKGLSENAPMPINNKVNNNYAAVSFGNIEYTKAGQYKYSIKESSINNHDGFILSKDVIYVLVDVSENNEELSAQVKYYYDDEYTDEINTPVIINEYPSYSPVSAHLEINKAITGEGAPNVNDTSNYFNFEVTKDNDDSILPTVTTVSNNGAKVIFSDVLYEKEGQYKYKINEKATAGHPEFSTSSKTIYALVDVKKSTDKYKLEATVHYYSDSAYTKEITSPTITNTYVAPKASISLTKLSDTADLTPLVGAHYGIYSQSECKDSQLLDVMITDSNGQAKTDKEFIKGTYYVKEIQAPAGYTISSIVYPVSIVKDGETAIVKTDADKDYVVDAQTKVSITKTNLKGDKILPNAKLQIIDSDGKVVKEWISSDKSYDIEGELIAKGTYTLHEVSAPKGYELAADIKFEVEAYDNDVTNITMKDAKTDDSHNVDTGDNSSFGNNIVLLMLSISVLGILTFKKQNKE